jgi:hypothetical protein
MIYILIVLACIAILCVLLFAIRRTNSPLNKTCSTCGGESRFGYSDHAEEDAEKIRPMCLNCLLSPLEKDYSSFAGRAIVIQPAAGLPVYVYQPVKEWQEYFKESKIGANVNVLLLEMAPACHDCGQEADYLWVGSAGLTYDNYEKTLDDGLSATLLRNNPKPISLCAKCAVQHIAKDLRDNNLTYLEICGPKGDGNGFVIPMAY